MWEQFVDALFKYAIDALVCGLASWAVVQWRKLNALQDGLQSMLQLSLIQTHDKRVAQGNISMYERKNFDKRYDSYKILGADGVIDSLVAEVQQLPITTRG